MTKPHQHPLQKILESRIAIIDGAMGTTIRTYGMTEADIRGERFRNATKDLKNNGDLFSLTQPQMICDIHRRFLEAGADIIETNTFGATSITQSEFFVDDPREHGRRKDPAFYQKVIDDKFLGDLAWEINEQSARQCREWADRVANETGRPRFVAGAIGPLTVSLSNSPDADDAGFRQCGQRASGPAKQQVSQARVADQRRTVQVGAEQPARVSPFGTGAVAIAQAANDLGQRPGAAADGRDALMVLKSGQPVNSERRVYVSHHFADAALLTAAAADVEQAKAVHWLTLSAAEHRSDELVARAHSEDHGTGLRRAGQPAISLQPPRGQHLRQVFAATEQVDITLRWHGLV